jgi:hypothetical protein
LCEILFQLAVSFIPWEITLQSHYFLNILKTFATFLNPFLFLLVPLITGLLPCVQFSLVSLFVSVFPGCRFPSEDKQ